MTQTSAARGVLYVVATPIGNLGDMTARAAEALSSADIIAAEDTRVTKVLLNRFGIKTPAVSCHKYNEAERLDFFIGELLAGKSVALVSDAGTPCVSDPGHRLVARAAGEGVAVTPVGAGCAAAAALSVSGFDASAFRFAGFFPRARKDGEKLIGETSGVLVFYESPKRVLKTMELFKTAAPDARVCLCNDLTKKFERIYRGAPEAVLSELLANPGAGKGEYTCVAELRPRNKTETASPDGLSLEAALADVIFRENRTLKEAVQILRERLNKPKKEIYAAALRLKRADYIGTDD